MTIGPILKMTIIVIQYICQLLPLPYNYICTNYDNLIDHLAHILELYNRYKPELEMFLIPLAQLRYLTY